MSSTSWNADRVTTLKALWLEGRSAAEIAKALGGVSRNAVIGKVHRLGLAERMTPSAPRRPAGKPSARPPRRASAPRPPSPPAAPAVRARPRERVIVEAVARVFDVRALSARVCRWPVGDPKAAGFGYCGAHVEGKGPYCEPHHHVACPPRPQLRPDREGRADWPRAATLGGGLRS